MPLLTWIQNKFGSASHHIRVSCRHSVCENLCLASCTPPVFIAQRELRWVYKKVLPLEKSEPHKSSVAVRGQSWRVPNPLRANSLVAERAFRACDYQGLTRVSHDSPNRGSGIARNSAARSKKMSRNRSKVGSRKIDSESPSESRPSMLNWAIPPVRLALSGRNSGKIPERPRKRSQSVSWNSRREYGWDAPNPIIQGIWGFQSVFPEFPPPQYGWGRLFFQNWFRRGPFRAGHGIPSSTGGNPDLESHNSNRTIPRLARFSIQNRRFSATKVSGMKGEWQASVRIFEEERRCNTRGGNASERPLGGKWPLRGS